MTKEEQFNTFWAAYPRRAAKNPCSVEGCEGERKGDGLCSSHLNRLKRYGNPLGGSKNARHGESVRWLQRIWSLDADECQIWPFKNDGNGYGIFALNGVYYRPHRFACEMFNGPPPTEGHEAAHECGVSLCCNKKHLAWKTHVDNIADKRIHGTLPTGEKHPQSKLTEADVRQIRAAKGKTARRSLAAAFSVGISTIDNILDGVTWRGVA